MPRTRTKGRFFKLGPVQGMREVTTQLALLDKQVRAKLVAFLKEEGKRVLKRAKELAPVSTTPYYKQGRKITRGGRLRDSGRVLTFGRTRQPRVDIVFGGKIVKGIVIDYASAVHERTDVRHKKGKAKFLEIAGKELGPSIGRNMAGKIDKEVRKIASSRKRLVR